MLVFHQPLSYQSIDELVFEFHEFFVCIIRAIVLVEEFAESLYAAFVPLVVTVETEF